MKKRYITTGERVRIEVSHSEAAMSMRVAGTIMDVELVRQPGGYHVAQLYTLEGKHFSFPVTCGEAGIYQDEHGHYVYPVDAEDRVA